MSARDPVGEIGFSVRDATSNVIARTDESCLPRLPVGPRRPHPDSLDGAEQRVGGGDMRTLQSNTFRANPFAHGSRAVGKESLGDSQVALEAMILAEDLSVVFQPIVRIRDGAVFAYEALTRCRVPAFRDPMALFERAMHAGCCGRLGRMVREVAIPLCEGMPLFVNVHPRELEERWLVRPDDPLYAHDRTVYLEVTEAVPIAQFDLCRSVLREIRQRTDARLVIDDLGAGFSNLSLIADLAPDIVKLDRSLIASIHANERRRWLVGSVVEMCARLGAQVVAEGIETHAELEAVRECGVAYGQGFLFAPPAFPPPMWNTIAPPATPWGEEPESDGDLPAVAAQTV